MGRPADLPSRYRVVGPLGEGGMGEVWHVVDLRDGSDRALKIVRRSRDTLADQQIAREFGVLASLRHPNLARVYDYGRLADGRAFYTAERVLGRPLSAIAGLVPIAIACRIAAVLCRVLDYLAARDLVHNDVKLSNVIVPAPDGQGAAGGEAVDGLRLLDFGAARLASTSAQHGPGTPPYMAPERLRGSPGTHRSDLYALGVTMYRTITGRLPFPFEHPDELLAAIARGAAPARGHRPDCPAALDELVGALLEPEARSRPLRAHEVIERMVAAGLGSFPLETPGTKDAYALSSAFAGRDAEVGALLRAVAGAGRAGAVLLAVVRGPAGSGKSRLLAELKVRLQLDGRRVAITRCLPGGAPFAPVLDLLAQVERPAPPELVGDPAPGRAVVEAGERLRRADAGAAALRSAAGAGPLCAIVDDLDRADDGTLATLAALERAGAAASAPLLVVGAVREDRIDEALAARLDAWAGRPSVLALPLGPLSEASLGSMLDSLFGPAVFGDRAARDLVRRAAGSPLVIQELVRAMLRRGTLRGTQAGWELLAAAAMPDEPGPEPALASIYRERLAALPAPARQAALALAVLGSAQPLSIVAEVADMGEDLGAALGVLDSEGLLGREGASVRLFHEDFAEIVLGASPPPVVLHARAATALERAGADEAALARHYIAAGDSQRGFRAGLRAGLRAAAAGEFRAALPLLRGARDLADAARASTIERWKLAEALGDALGSMDSEEEAAAAYEQALALTDGELDRARVCGKAARACVGRFQFPEAERWVARAGEPPAAAVLPELEFARLYLLIGRGEPAAAAARCRSRLEEIDRLLPGAPGDAARLEVEIVAGQAAQHLGDEAVARAHFERAAAIARAEAWPLGEARAASALAWLAQSTDLRGAEAALERALDLCERVGHLRLGDMLITALAANRLQLGDLDAAADLLDRALARQRRRKGPEEPILVTLGQVEVLRGDRFRARSILARVLAGTSPGDAAWIRGEAALWLSVLDALEGVRGSRHFEITASVAAASGADPDRAQAWAAEGFARAAEGEPIEGAALLARAEAVLARRRLVVFAAAARFAQAELLARGGRAEEAAAAFRDAEGRFAGVGNTRAAALARQRARSLPGGPPADGLDTSGASGQLTAAGSSLAESPTVAGSPAALDHPTATRILELTVGAPLVAGLGGRSRLVGRSAGVRRILDAVRRLGTADVPVLVQGESGTGKDLVARALHAQGPRSKGPFVAVNCASLVPTLAESDLFGHVRGAFSGADRDRRGLFEEADGGTLFLDEIADLDPRIQAKLLRVIEDGIVRPLGATTARSRHVRCRIIAASNRDLAAEVAAGRFRSDLYHRLSVVELHLPALRERTDDLPLLMRHFLARLIAEEAPGAGQTGRRARISSSAMRCLVSYAWPGNVRELENELRRAVLLAAGGPIRPEHLSPRLRGSPDQSASGRAAEPAAGRDALAGPAPGAGSPGTLDEVERRLRLERRQAAIERQSIANALASAGGNKARAARTLGVSRPTLYARMRLYRMPDRG